jgi:hypothetical protein
MSIEHEKLPKKFDPQAQERVQCAAFLQLIEPAQILDSRLNDLIALSIVLDNL